MWWMNLKELKYRRNSRCCHDLLNKRSGFDEIKLDNDVTKLSVQEEQN